MVLPRQCSERVYARQGECIQPTISLFVLFRYEISTNARISYIFTFFMRREGIESGDEIVAEMKLDVVLLQQCLRTVYVRQ